MSYCFSFLDSMSLVSEENMDLTQAVLPQFAHPQNGKKGVYDDCCWNCVSQPTNSNAGDRGDGSVSGGDMLELVYQERLPPLKTASSSFSGLKYYRNLPHWSL